MFKLDKDLIIIDVETSGSNFKTSSIIQLGAVEFSKAGEWTGRFFDSYIKPYTDEWSEKAAQIHRIKKEFLLEKGKDIKDALIDFQEFIGKGANEFYIAQWSCGFDTGMLQQAYSKSDLSYPFHYRSYDIASIVRFFLAFKSSKHVSSLSDCAKALNIDTSNYNHHNAAHDAMLTAVCLKKVIDEILSKKDN